MFRLNKNINIIPFAAKIKLHIAYRIIALENFVLTIFRKLLFRSNPISPRNILLFRTGSLGDSICAIPSIVSIRRKYPDAKIDILTNAGKKTLVGLEQLLDKNIYDNIIDYLGASKSELIKTLRHNKYDFIMQLAQVDAPFWHMLRDLFVFRLIAPAGFGWNVSQVKLFTKTQSKYIVFPDERTRLLEMLKSEGVENSFSPTLVHPSEEDIKKVQEIWQQFALRHSDELIAIVVGAKRPQNRWPIGYFKKVVQHFSKKYKIILIGSADDVLLVKPLSTINNVYNTCGLLTPLQSAAALDKCLLTISNDTGPMHLSYAVGTPVVAIFSSRDLAGKWYPPLGNSIALRAENIVCEGCYSEVCDNNICMQSILPEKVIAVVEEILPTIQSSNKIQFQVNTF